MYGILQELKQLSAYQLGSATWRHRSSKSGIDRGPLELLTSPTTERQRLFAAAAHSSSSSPRLQFGSFPRRSRAGSDIQAETSSLLPGLAKQDPDEPAAHAGKARLGLLLGSDPAEHSNDQPATSLVAGLTCQQSDLVTAEQRAREAYPHPDRDIDQRGYGSVAAEECQSESAVRLNRAVSQSGSGTEEQSSGENAVIAGQKPRLELAMASRGQAVSDANAQPESGLITAEHSSDTGAQSGASPPGFEDDVSTEEAGVRQLADDSDSAASEPESCSSIEEQVTSECAALSDDRPPGFEAVRVTQEPGTGQPAACTASGAVDLEPGSVTQEQSSSGAASQQEDEQAGPSKEKGRPRDSKVDPSVQEKGPKKVTSAGIASSSRHNMYHPRTM